MTRFILDAALARDSFALGQLAACQIRLMNNAAVPWIIVVPETSVTELCDLAADERAALTAVVDATARYIRTEFTVDKLNVAAIGNCVRQLHVHVVGRHAGDYCWPGVVWETVAPVTYAPLEVERIAASWRARCGRAA
jgi:diadenosine tetraphosphate (Ap4A) HIT family hydrolase